jgi:hypothetical protein
MRIAGTGILVAFAGLLIALADGGVGLWITVGGMVAYLPAMAALFMAYGRVMRALDPPRPTVWCFRRTVLLDALCVKRPDGARRP